VLLLERRAVLGGAAVTEEMVPGETTAKRVTLHFTRPSTAQSNRGSEAGMMMLCRTTQPATRHNIKWLVKRGKVKSLLGHGVSNLPTSPGFRFSRASYLAGLLRPSVVAELGLESRGFKYLTRDPASFTPTRLGSAHEGRCVRVRARLWWQHQRECVKATPSTACTWSTPAVLDNPVPPRLRSLMLGSDAATNAASIAQFSQRDAGAFEHYEAFLGQVRELTPPSTPFRTPGDLGPGVLVWDNTGARVNPRREPRAPANSPVFEFSSLLNPYPNPNPNPNPII
jgi:hypothetical protein